MRTSSKNHNASLPLLLPTTQLAQQRLHRDQRWLLSHALRSQSRAPALSKPDRRQTDKRGFKTKRDAEAFAVTVEVKKLTGEFVSNSAGRVTIGALAPDWLARKEQSTALSNFRMIESAWRNHVAPLWADRRVADPRCVADPRIGIF